MSLLTELKKLSGFVSTMISLLTELSRFVQSRAAHAISGKRLWVFADSAVLHTDGVGFVTRFTEFSFRISGVPNRHWHRFHSLILTELVVAEFSFHFIELSLMPPPSSAKSFHFAIFFLATYFTSSSPSKSSSCVHRVAS